MNKKHHLEMKIRDSQVEIEQYINKLGTFERYNFLREDEILDAAEQDLDAKEQLLEKTEESIEAIKESLEEIDELISYHENEISGKQGGLIQGIREMAGFIQNNDISNVRDKLAEVKQKLDFIVNNLLDLMTLYIMKTILLPLLFMFLLTKSFKLIWAVEIRYFIK